MKLDQYLEAKKLSLGEFARAIGAKNARTVQRYVRHGRVPSGRMMARIAAETDGAVQPNDFYADAAE